MTILVTGATGNIGRLLVDELLRAGAPVRALTRDPAKARLPEGVEVVAGDLNDPESLRPALHGVTALHLLTFSDKDNAALATGPEIAALAKEAGVERVTLLWSGTDGPVEEAVEASGLAWTRLQPVEFMSNMLGWAETIRDHGEVREAFPDSLNATVHEADIAAVAAKALLEDGHKGQAYSITGPAALTVPDKVAALSAALGRELRFVELTREQAAEKMRADGVTEDLVDFVLGWHADPPPEGYTVAPTVEQVTGRPARSFADWAVEHADRFS